MYTYQDRTALGDDENERMDFVQCAVKAHKQTTLYRVAKDAEQYDMRRTSPSTVTKS